jgi:arginyl-tRNA--protein-N-Asp/Glu arginylyltransferase
MTAYQKGSPQFYLTAPTPCPYLRGRYERKVFTHLAGERAADLNDILTQGGFRRSQSIAYRPACEGCRACISVRILVDEFEPSRTQNRITRYNRDLIAMAREPIADASQYALFRDYLDARHADGGMADMTVLDYSMMVEDTAVNTSLFEYRVADADSGITGRSKGELLACALTDTLSDGLSMVYAFFDPAARKRSLGTYMILDHIARARKLGLPYVYLGYWVDGSRKMDYKIQFKPQEHLMQGGWTRMPISGPEIEDGSDIESQPQLKAEPQF